MESVNGHVSKLRLSMVTSTWSRSFFVLRLTVSHGKRMPPRSRARRLVARAGADDATQWSDAAAAALEKAIDTFAQRIVARAERLPGRLALPQVIAAVFAELPAREHAAVAEAIRRALV